MKKIGYSIITCFLFLGQLTAQDNAVELFNKAIEFKKSNNCIRVLSLLDSAIELQPDFANAWIEKGWCLNELNRSKEALPVLRKAATFSKNDYRVYFETAHAYSSLGNSDSALKYFKETLRFKPDYLAANVLLADLYREKFKNTGKALNYYLKASLIDTAHKKTNYWIGWCFNESEKFDSAVYYLQKVVMVDANNPPASFELGFAFYSLHKFTEAIEAFKPALAAKPKTEIAVYYSGLCQVRINNKGEALNRYNELVISNSSYAANLLTEIQKMK